MKLLTLFFTGLVSVCAFAAAPERPPESPVELDPIFKSEPEKPTRGSRGISKELIAMVEAALRTDDSTRRPASIPKAQKPSQKGLASTLKEGFEYKVYQGKRVTAFWVLKRQDQFDLVFATNGGSRQTTDLKVEHFRTLIDQADSLRSPASSLSQCKSNYVRLVVVSGGKEEREVSACLDSKAPSTESLKKLGNALASYVR